jgi:hypothetical protein
MQVKELNLVMLKDNLREFRIEFPETIKIFNTLSSGGFINKSSSSLEEQRHYKTLTANSNVFKEYFLIIGFELIIEDGYCYFVDKINSANDEKVTSENQTQIGKVVEYLEIFILLKTVFNSIDLVDSFEFTIGKLEEAINNNSEYKSKVPNLNKSESNRKAIENLLSKFSSSGFIEEINKKDGRYKTLDCLKYIINVAHSIDMIEEN